MVVDGLLVEEVEPNPTNKHNVFAQDGPVAKNQELEKSNVEELKGEKGDVRP